MPSNSRETRENQIKSYDQRILERRADLAKKGMDPKDFDKDKVYEHLKAKRRDLMKALAAIDQLRARNEQPKKEKTAKAAPAKA
jgi:hypothetical protein